MGVYKEEAVEVSTDMEVAKFKEAEQLVFGWASIALTAKGIPAFDWEGDIMSPQVLEKAVYDFVLKYRVTGEMHEGGTKGSLVESVIFTKEKMAAMKIPEGIVPEGWWVGFHIPDAEVFGKVKSGVYKMFSIQGKIKRLKV